jgi:hypothetical protein
MRRYRTHPGFWGVGFSKSPGNWAIQFGPWVWTTEPE